MKKVLTGLVIFLLLGMNITTENSSFTTGCKSAFGANVMTTDSYFFTIADEIAPLIQNISPAPGATDQPVDVNISFDVVDNESGVDLPTVVVMGNGSVLPYTSTPIANGYHVEISGLNFGYNARVDFTITVEDLAN